MPKHPLAWTILAAITLLAIVAIAHAQHFCGGIVSIAGSTITPPALVQQNSATTNTTSLAVSLTNPVTVGDTLVAVFNAETASYWPGDTNGSTIMSSPANTWACCPTTAVRDTTSFAVETQICYASNVAAGSTTVTVTLHAVEVQGMKVSEWSGVAGGSPRDVCGTGANSAGTQGTSITTGSIATSNTDLIIASGAVPSGSVTVTGPTNSFTALGNPDQTTGLTSLGAYQTPISGSYNTGWSINSNQYWAGEILGLKSSGTGGPPPSCATTIPNTSIGVGTTCLPSGDIPTLSNSQNPNSFGADNTGATDSTAAVASALGAGDVHFTAGTYLLNACEDCTGAGTPWSFCTSGTSSCSGVSTAIVAQGTNANYGIRPPAGRNIECDSGVTLKMSLTSLQNNHDTGLLFINNNNVTIEGCTIKGANSNSPAPLNNSSMFGIHMSGGSGDTIEGNVIENFEGNAGLEITPDIGTTTNATIRYNTFQNNPLYGVVVSGVMSGTNSIDHNLSYDNEMGAEWDGCTGTIGTGIVFSNNFVRYDDNLGNCQQAGVGSCGDTAGGDTAFQGEAYVASGTCNYSGMTIGPNNYCLGGTSITTHINGGFGGTNSGTSNLVTYPGTNYALGAHCTCTNMGSGQTCP